MIQALSYDFVQNALLASLLASIVCGLTGTYIVSKRLVFIGGGISHASFGGIGIAHFLGVNPFFGALVFTVLSAMGIHGLSRQSLLSKDTLIGILWSFGMAVGIIFIFLTPGYTPNLMTFLFGNILTVSATELWLAGVITVLVCLLFLLNFRTILYIAYDEEYARTARRGVNLLNLVLMIAIALSIVVSIRVAGIILVISLLSIPPAIGRLLDMDFKGMMLFSVILSFVASLAGIAVSFMLDIPTGASVIIALVLMFIIAWTWRKLKAA